MLNKLRKLLRQYDMVSPGDHVICAVSGGADSVAALAVLQQLGYQCVAAHCNFHLRGEESERDRAVAEVIYRDGSHLDTIYNVPVK